MNTYEALDCALLHLLSVVEANKPAADMWTHLCPVERVGVSVAHNEPCNWCDKEEDTNV